ncbi:MAG: hypothetical protein HY613_06045 [Candidatus Rokubacteria bacterium]|nr:hypothetical protein [Candidatus Rokubacteria bacterium]
MKPRLLAFGGEFLYELVTASADFAVDFYATESERKFRLLTRLRTEAPDALERYPIRRWTLSDLPEIGRKVRAGVYDAVLCQHIRYALWSPVLPLLTSLRRGWQTLAGERASLIRFFLPRWVVGTGVPMAFVSPEDSPTIEAQNHPLLRVCRLCFVRELPVNPAHLLLNTAPGHRRIVNVTRQRELDQIWRRLRPISLGLRERTASLIERFRVQHSDRKDIDVFFAGWTRPYTARDPIYARQLRSLEGEGWRVEVTEDRIPQETFLEKCCRSWLVWSPQGLGWECWRHYEAAAAGAVPVINMPTIRRYAPLEHGRHALFYCVEGDHLGTVVRDALRDKDRLWAMGRAARQHVLDHHLHSRLLHHLVASLTEETERTNVPAE